MQETPAEEARHADSGGRRRYRAQISRTLLDYATDQRRHSDSLTAFVLADTDGAIASQLQHAIARAGVEWPSIDETVVVSRTTADEGDNRKRKWENVWFYLCFRNNELFALLTPISIQEGLDVQAQPEFECALLEPNTRRRRSKHGETHYSGTSSSIAGKADWRVTLSDEGFSLRLSRIANDRQAVVTTIDAIAEDHSSSPAFRPLLLLERITNTLRSLTNRLARKRHMHDQRHAAVDESLLVLDNHS